MTCCVGGGVALRSVVSTPTVRRWISSFRAFRFRQDPQGQVCGSSRVALATIPKSGSPFVHLDTGRVQALAAHDTPAAFAAVFPKGADTSCALGRETAESATISPRRNTSGRMGETRSDSRCVSRPENPDLSVCKTKPADQQTKGHGRQVAEEDACLPMQANLRKTHSGSRGTAAGLNRCRSVVAEVSAT